MLPLLLLALTGEAGDPAPSTTEATPPLERITLVYGAPPECPPEAAFRAEVHERATGDWEAAPGELARRIDVSVTRRGERYIASIGFLNAQGERIGRSFSGKACADVVDGIALVTALAIQARVEDALARSEPEPPASEPVSPATPLPRAPTPAPLVPTAARETHLRFGVAAKLANGVGPGPGFGPAAFGVLEWRRSRIGLGFAALFSGEVTANGVPALYRRFSGRLDGCPYVWGSSALAFEPCAFFDAGVLYGEGIPSGGLASTSGGTAPWLVPGVLLRVVAGFGGFVVAAEVGGGPPLVRERFGVTHDGVERTTFHVPALVLEGSLGVGWRL